MRKIFCKGNTLESCPKLPNISERLVVECDMYECKTRSKGFLKIWNHDSNSNEKTLYYLLANACKKHGGDK